MFKVFWLFSGYHFCSAVLKNCKGWQSPNSCNVLMPWPSLAILLTFWILKHTSNAISRSCLSYQSLVVTSGLHLDCFSYLSEEWVLYWCGICKPFMSSTQKSKDCRLEPIGTVADGWRTWLDQALPFCRRKVSNTALNSLGFFKSALRACRIHVVSLLL